MTLTICHFSILQIELLKHFISERKLQCLLSFFRNKVVFQAYKTIILKNLLMGDFGSILAEMPDFRNFWVKALAETCIWPNRPKNSSFQGFVDQINAILYYWANSSICIGPFQKQTHAADLQSS